MRSENSELEMPVVSRFIESPLSTEAFIEFSFRVSIKMYYYFFALSIKKSMKNTFDKSVYHGKCHEFHLCSVGKSQ